MRFLFVEPFFGGSHRDFAQGLVRHSIHEIDLHTLPARFWKWRMRGAALHFLQAIDDLRAYDGVIATGLMSLADFFALGGPYRPPVLLYLHENQLTYPLAPGEQMDMQFGFTDITSALCADRIIFNSRFHHAQFFAALPEFIGHMPEYKPHWAVNAIRSKSMVLYPGCQFTETLLEPAPISLAPPMIVWNHRWEFDKGPEAFFAALDAVVRRGIDFRLAILGENCQVKPQVFVEARSRFGPKIVQYGYVATKQAYIDWLRQGFVAVSTAQQENFGIAMIEAMRHGCLPLMPHRLAYPEILPREFHAAYLYRSQTELVDRLADMLRHPHRHVVHRPVLADMMARHAWSAVIDRYDRQLASLVEDGRRTANGTGRRRCDGDMASPG